MMIKYDDASPSPNRSANLNVSTPHPEPATKQTCPSPNMTRAEIFLKRFLFLSDDSFRAGTNKTISLG